MAQTIFLTIEDNLLHTTGHSGPAFQANNKRLYRLLKPLNVNSPAWPFMQPFNHAQDGRGTFLATKAQAEGLAAITTHKAAAYAQIVSTKFTRKGRYTLDQYIVCHQKAFNELETLSQPVPEDKKVGDFMSHIHDACLTTARDLIFGNPEYSNSFEKAQQYCKGLLAHNSIHAMHTGKDSHHVLKTQCKQGNNKKSTKTGGKHVHAGRYSPQEYCVLTLLRHSMSKLRSI